MKSKTFFINPPSPTGVMVIRDVYRCGRTSKEGMIWPQTQLAELATLEENPRIIDCIAENISWAKLKKIFYKEKPNKVTFQVIPATYHNDMKIADLSIEVGASFTPMGAHFAGNFKSIDLATMPTPRYDLLPLRKYVMPFFGKYIIITASRGCPFNCIFCRERVAFKGKVQYRPVDSIIKDIRLLKKYKIDTYLFHAGNFTTSKPWVMEFCEKVGKEKIRWSCNTHLKTIDRQMANAMKRAGCWMVAPGIETTNDDILKTIHKEIDISTIYRKLFMLKSEGLEVWGYFIFGLPGETQETIFKTIEDARSLPLDIAHFGIATPYYGTEFYRMCRENNWLKSAQWEAFDQNQSVNVEYLDLSAEDIRKAIRRAYKRFYFRPKQIARLVKEGLNTEIFTLGRILKGLL